MFSFISLARVTAAPRRRGCQTEAPARDLQAPQQIKAYAAKYSLNAPPQVRWRADGG